MVSPACANGCIWAGGCAADCSERSRNERAIGGAISMQAFVLLIICCVTLNDFIVREFNLPTLVHFLPEVMSGIVVLYVAIVGTRDRFRLVAPKYWFAFGAFALLIVCGVVNNGTGTGQM